MWLSSFPHSTVHSFSSCEQWYYYGFLWVYFPRYKYISEEFTMFSILQNPLRAVADQSKLQRKFPWSWKHFREMNTCHRIIMYTVNPFSSALILCISSQVANMLLMHYSVHDSAGRRMMVFVALLVHVVFTVPLVWLPQLGPQLFFRFLAAFTYNASVVLPLIIGNSIYFA